MTTLEARNAELGTRSKEDEAQQAVRFFDQTPGVEAEQGQQAAKEDARGRPRVLTDGKKLLIATLLREGVSLRKCAMYAHCVHGTIINELKRDPLFAAIVRSARLCAETEPLAQIRKAAKTSWRAAAWLVARLERQKKEEAELEREFEETLMSLDHPPIDLGPLDPAAFGSPFSELQPQPQAEVAPAQPEPEPEPRPLTRQQRRKLQRSEAKRERRRQHGVVSDVAEPPANLRNLRRELDLLQRGPLGAR
jgi:hypothetical protein